MTLDWDEKIRMDCSSPSAMASLIKRMAAGADGTAAYDVATGNDADADRHGIVTPGRRADEPEPLPRRRHRLPVPEPQRLEPGVRGGQDPGVVLDHRPRCRRTRPQAGRGSRWLQVVRSRPALRRRCLRWRRIAGASFNKLDGSVWTTDKDGILLALLASEITAVTGQSPSQLYKGLTDQFGAPVYARIDAAATREQKSKLGKLSAADVTATSLAGEEITAKLTEAPGNGASIGGLKVVTENALVRGPPLRHRGRLQDLRRVLQGRGPLGAGAARGQGAGGRGYRVAPRSLPPACFLPTLVTFFVARFLVQDMGVLAC